MIVPHPLWKEIKPSKKSKEQYKKLTGLNLERIVVAKKNWYKLFNKLIVL